jgi:hypothetical protein
MSKQTPTPLEKRIASALSNAAVHPLRDPIAETEAVLTTAQAKAQAEREKGARSNYVADSAEAERSAWAAELNRDRLGSSLCRLRLRFDEVATAEYTANWDADYEDIEAQQNALAKEFSETYQNVTNQLIDLFRRALAIDQECARVNGRARAGERRRLPGVERTARGLLEEGFSFSTPALTEAVKLPECKDSGRLAWPPPKMPLAALVAAAMTPPHDPRFTADWAAARQQDMARRAAAEARRAEEEASRQVACRNAYEAFLRR